MKTARVASFVVAGLCRAFPLFAGFASNEIFLPAVGRAPGQNSAQIYTTVWATNLTQAPETFTFHFLKEGQANPSASAPIARSQGSGVSLASSSFSDTLAPGQTKVYEDIVETKLGLTGVIGAARIVSSGEIFVAERIFNESPGDDLGKTEGMFFAGVPRSFSIALGQSASLQGVNQGGSEDFRSNFVLVETGGGSPTVNVQVFDGNGALLGQKAYAMLPYEQILPGVADVVPGIATTNARITATVTGGTGSVILALAQVANGSQDSSGVEMSFRDALLGGGVAGDCTLCVTSLNGLTGAVTIAHGANTTVNVNGQTITIDAVSGSGTGLTAVAHDNSLAGSGTVGVPLGIANGQVVRSLNGLHDAVTLAAGSNVTITPSGQTLTIASTGLTLPYSGSWNDTTPAFTVSNTGGGTAIVGQSTTEIWVARFDNSAGDPFGGGGGVRGSSPTGVGVLGSSNSFYGVFGSSDSQYGVYGSSGKNDAIFGETFQNTAAGVVGKNTVTLDQGYLGGENYGVLGTSGNSNAIIGKTSLNTAAGVEGDNTVSGTKGYLGGENYGVYAFGGFAGTGGKYFIEPHPSDPTKEIRYVCLEGPESGTYFRGTGRIVNGFATIEVPEHFRMVTAEKGLTVVATPVGGLAVLAAVRQDLDKIVIQGSSDVEFNYLVNGVRKALEDHRPISENRDFIPKSASDADSWKALPAESIRRLKANGTLNPDGTINLETAHRLGWDKQKSWKRAVADTKN